MTDERSGVTSLESPTAILARHQRLRQRCEIWSRVMGYHRPVHTWNVGKQGEHEERALFVEPPHV